MPVLGGLPVSSAQWFVPTRMEGATVFVDGNSIPAGAGIAFPTQGIVAKTTRRLGLGTVTNHAVSGYTSARIVASTTSYTGGYLPGDASGFGVIWDGAVNDMGQGGTDPKALAKFTNALTYHALLLRVRTDSAPSLSVDGNWAADVSNDQLGTGGGYNTTTQNAVATLTGLRAASKAMILLMGIDDAFNDTGAGATYTITTQSDSVAETTVATGTTSNKFFKGSDAQPRALMPVVVDVAAGANPLVKVKKSDAGATVLHICTGGSKAVMDVGTPNLPTAVYIKQPYVPLDVANATNDVYRAIQLSVLTSTLGPEGAAWVLADVDAEGWNAALHTQDTVHPNTIGCTLYAQAIARAVGRIAYLP